MKNKSTCKACDAERRAFARASATTDDDENKENVVPGQSASSPAAVVVATKKDLLTPASARSAAHREGAWQIYHAAMTSPNPPRREPKDAYSMTNRPLLRVESENIVPTPLHLFLGLGFRILSGFARLIGDARMVPLLEEIRTFRSRGPNGAFDAFRLTGPELAKWVKKRQSEKVTQMVVRDAAERGDTEWRSSRAYHR